jgi:hypothetical protein
VSPELAILAGVGHHLVAQAERGVRCPGIVPILTRRGVA